MPRYLYGLITKTRFKVSHNQSTISLSIQLVIAGSLYHKLPSKGTRWLEGRVGPELGPLDSACYSATCRKWKFGSAKVSTLEQILSQGEPCHLSKVRKWKFLYAQIPLTLQNERSACRDHSQSSTGQHLGTMRSLPK